MDTTPVTIETHYLLDDKIMYATTMRGVNGVFSTVTADQAREAFLRSSRAHHLIFIPIRRA